MCRPMTDKKTTDWNPSSDAVTENQVAAYDKMRAACPVAFSESRGWSIFRHDDVMRILCDHESFSNAVSQHLSVPNGMDLPAHTLYREMIEKYFVPERMSALEPVCRKIATDLIATAITAGSEVEVMSALATRFAARSQCAFLGWPDRLHVGLIDWTARNQQAVRESDRSELSRLAREFEGIVDEIIEGRRTGVAEGSDDITSSLIREQIHGRKLSSEEVSSILRNWTVGEIGTLSASIGILLEYLAKHAELQMQLRRDAALLPTAIDEILRIHNPLVNNRRVTTCPVKIGDRQLGAGDKVSVNWISANRDESVFELADQVCLDRDPSKNLLYGAGIHVCPGAPLARMELRVFLETLFQSTSKIAPLPNVTPVLETYPASGFSSVVLRMVRPQPS